MNNFARLLRHHKSLRGPPRGLHVFSQLRGLGTLLGAADTFARSPRLRPRAGLRAPSPSLTFLPATPLLGSSSTPPPRSPRAEPS